jgi:cobalt-zinc-cadmium efflux system protein
MVTLVAHLGVAKVDWFGTSMGGMIGMVYAGMADSPIRKLLLNDVGPRIEPAALKRLGSYVGKPLRFTNRADALAQLNLLCTPFGEHTDAEWDEYNGPHLVEHEGASIISDNLSRCLRKGALFNALFGVRIQD